MTSRGTARRLMHILVALLVSGIVGSCSGNAPRKSAPRFGVVAPVDPAGKELLIVLGPDRENVARFYQALAQEVGEDFELLGVVVDPAQDSHKLQRTLDQREPRLVVVVDNPTIASYRTWARRRSTPPAAILVMSSFVEQLQPTVPNSVAISYETPAVTTVVGMQSVLRRKISNVGILFRRDLAVVVERESRLLAREQIRVESEEVSHDPSVDEVKRGLRRLRRRGVDCLWVMNDDRLLTRRLLSEAWIPFAEARTLPIAVGVASLIGEDTHFGVYAAVPNLSALAVQAADVAYLLRESGFVAVGERVRQPFSTQAHLDWPLALELGGPSVAPDEVDVLVGWEE